MKRRTKAYMRKRDAQPKRFAAQEARDDVGLRTDVVDSFASIAVEVLGGCGVFLGSASSGPQSNEATVDRH